ncbi:hypothetical protein H8Z55_17490 [Mycobacteroides abscessus]|uniref:hypothetical protein n=1 Tax=Mycobacteroides abscessus TaxID=36809 RepID=UPI001CDD62C9|nr:hypothetical protein [Mycobacteroides abscessus]MCA4749585.1 hypothetical protein [Mycobacteroides abscessus]MCA4767257.1 hypothetical protein [Mycobacteroides abscessus]UBV08844.1 hypothetical protein H8Z55_17490 [Mycobacteroides abscessus]UBV26036.1 hypothetical protein H8Z67_17420 [Mycobacteroides abscessus]
MADRADYDRAQFTDWLTASCERQGVPVTVSDPAVIAQVTTLLRPNLRTGRKPA